MLYFNLLLRFSDSIGTLKIDNALKNGLMLTRHFLLLEPCFSIGAFTLKNVLIKHYSFINLQELNIF